MNARRDPALALLMAIIAGAGISGCGLKGPLTLPEKSGNVVVRDKAAATGSSGTTAAPGEPKAEPPAPPLPQKMPPPELPPSSNGTSR